MAVGDVVRVTEQNYQEFDELKIDGKKVCIIA
jgi:hypothetical protein